ncbi:hypothetical protein [Allofranklinella schreckenbergeri]
MQGSLLFRWFIGLWMDDTVRLLTVFTKNCHRLIECGAVQELFEQALARP